jgi:hypothetical protein
MLKASALASALFGTGYADKHYYCTFLMLAQQRRPSWSADTAVDLNLLTLEG